MRAVDQVVFGEGVQITPQRFRRDVKPLCQSADPDMRPQFELEQDLATALGFLELSTSRSELVLQHGLIRKLIHVLVKIVVYCIFLQLFCCINLV